MEVLFLVGLFQSLFFAVFLLTKKENKKANVLLGIWLIFLALYFVEIWFNISEAYLNYPHFIGIFSGLPLLHGPFLLLYALFLTNLRHRWQLIDYLHFVPFLLYYVFFFFSFFQLGGSAKLEVMENIMQGNIPLKINIQGFIKASHGIIYSLVTLFFLRQFKRRLLANFSNTDKINLQWLRNLSYGFLGVYTLALMVQISSLTGNYSGEGPVGLLGVILIFLVAFMGLRQGEIFLEEQKQAGPVDPALKVKYLHSRMDKTDIHQIKEQLIAIFETDKPHLDPEFRLSQLAEKVQIHTNDLSQVINEGFGKNFYALVNAYRIEEVKKNLQDPQNDHLTLLAIGLQSGFNSKTTFNTVFKKMTGQTPSEFKKQIESLSA